MNKNEKEKLKRIKKGIQEILAYVAPEIMFDHFDQKIFPAIDSLLGEEQPKWEAVISDDDFSDVNMAKCSYCNMTLIRGLGAWYTLGVGDRHFPCKRKIL